MFTLNCKGKLLLIEQPLVMGIINATPDSFYEGHWNRGLSGILELANTMISEGADILDIGGQSTRPGSERIPAEDELKRVLPVIEAIHDQHKEIFLSIDTYHSKVAEAAIAAGASIVNDISSGSMDDQMITTVAKLEVPYVCMHMQGTPDDMQKNPQYKNIIAELLHYFIHQTAKCQKAGIKDILIDPGFGFGKTIAHNFELLEHLNSFTMLDKPILAGLSRKSFLYKTAGVEAKDALSATIAANTIALRNGASVLRVHDVKEAKALLSVYPKYKGTSGEMPL